MKGRRSAGFTVLELLVLIGTLMVVVTLAMPQLSQGCKARASRISCTSNLKQIGLAYRTWANEHEERFPMELTVAEDGTKELALTGLPFSSFTIISNELNNPKPLHCPDDKKRDRATTFPQLTVKNISYFLGLDVTQLNPATILSGDRNLCFNGKPTYRLLQTTNWPAITWGANIHEHQGDLGLADGSAHQVTDVMLQRALQASRIATNRFAIP